MFRENFQWFSLWPVPLLLSLGTFEQSLALSFLHPLFSFLYRFIKSSPCPEPSLLRAEQSQLSQPLLTGDAPIPLLDYVHYVHVSLVLGPSELETILWLWPHVSQ